MTFVKRRIDATFNLATGQFGNNPGSDVTVSGYRTQATIVGYNGNVQTQLQLRIYGLSQSMMNQLTTIGPLFTERRKNSILLAAGDAGETALTVAYQGTIAQAWADYSQAPEVVFNVMAMGAALEAVKPVKARSYRGATPVATIVADIAAEMALTLENNGVATMLSNPYFPGTAVEQLRACAKAGRFHYSIDRGILAIWPHLKTRTNAGGPILIESGRNLIGYPRFTDSGVEFELLYTPNLGLGRTVQVISLIEAAHGEWVIVGLSHQLESEIPGGLWKSSIRCLRIIT